MPAMHVKDPWAAAHSQPYTKRDPSFHTKKRLTHRKMSYHRETEIFPHACKSCHMQKRAIPHTRLTSNTGLTTHKGKYYHIQKQDAPHTNMPYCTKF